MCWVKYSRGFGVFGMQRKEMHTLDCERIAYISDSITGVCARLMYFLFCCFQSSQCACGFCFDGLAIGQTQWNNLLSITMCCVICFSRTHTHMHAFWNCWWLLIVFISNVFLSFDKSLIQCVLLSAGYRLLFVSVKNQFAATSSFLFTLCKWVWL